MWAQMITVRVKEGAEGEIARVMEILLGVEQTDSGLLRHLVLRDQADPQLIRTVVVFESEEKARLREADPRRHEGQAAAQAVLSKAVAGPPEFANFDVLWEHTY